MKEKQYTDKNAYGTKFYFKDPELKIIHRLDGPAIEYPEGGHEWYANNKRHRIDGPAVEYTEFGDKAWFIDDVFILEVDKNDNIIDRMKD